MGEEMGWVGYALPTFQQRIAPLLSAVTLGVLRGLWHLPTFFMSGGVQAAFFMVGFALLLVQSAAARIMWTWIFNRTKGSVLIIALLHAASNGEVPCLPGSRRRLLR
jgi:membrane protease YdiL (CAAX protease family)